jgi:hypothetical protein
LQVKGIYTAGVLGIRMETSKIQDEKCGVEFRDGKAICSIHGVDLIEPGAVEISSPGISPHAYKATSFLCPKSGQQFPHIKLGR